MTEKACPAPNPEQRKFMEISENTEKTMLHEIHRAIEKAASDMADNVRAAGIEIPPTDRDYFTFAAQQVLFVRLCGGDPETLKGGDPELAQRIIGNYQHIVEHYWRRGGLLKG